jgi:hypothetical protein
MQCQSVKKSSPAGQENSREFIKMHENGPALIVEAMETGVERLEQERSGEAIAGV